MGIKKIVKKKKKKKEKKKPCRWTIFTIRLSIDPEESVVDDTDLIGTTKEMVLRPSATIS